MPVNSIDITHEDIRRSEFILFGRDNIFDKNQIEYIKSLETLDLNAVPGSGKTTLLLAKLLILDRKMPLSNNNGVLVLSHTNTAINEIESRVKPYCDYLFKFPNYIGTIQSFVNHFLAIPYFENKTKRKVVQISDEYYELAVERYYYNIKDKALLLWLNKQNNPLEFLKKLRFNSNFDLIEGSYGDAEKFRLKDKSLKTYRSLKDMKAQILQNGILCYSDAYILAIKYLKELPELKNIIANLFNYVFVDEMQDMDLRQFNIIEELFYNHEGVLQRLGDTNQAIFNGINKHNVEWNIRSNSIYISNSNRLSKSCADIATKFSLTNSSIMGLNNFRDNINPILYVYDDDLIKCNVIKQFAIDLNTIFSSEIVRNDDLVIKVVAWRKESDDEKKITLKTYCPVYNPATSKSRDVNYIDLFHTENIEINAVYNCIIDLICDTLIKRQILLGLISVKGMKDINELMFLGNNSNLYKMKLYDLCLFFINKEIDSFKSEFSGLIYLISEEFEISMSDYDISNIFDFNIDIEKRKSECNKCLVGKNPIVVTSVHSVKGETHDATLFMESYFNKKFESDLLYKVLLGEQVDEVIREIENDINKLNLQILELQGKRGTDSKIKLRDSKVLEKNRVMEYAKVLYVAFSRPKYVVAYAISKSRYDKFRLMESRIEWNTIFINKVIE